MMYLTKSYVLLFNNLVKSRSILCVSCSIVHHKCCATKEYNEGIYDGLLSWPLFSWTVSHGASVSSNNQQVFCKKLSWCTKKSRLSRSAIAFGYVVFPQNQTRNKWNVLINCSSSCTPYHQQCIYTGKSGNACNTSIVSGNASLLWITTGNAYFTASAACS